jgi:hypothetical protein
VCRKNSKIKSFSARKRTEKQLKEFLGGFLFSSSFSYADFSHKNFSHLNVFRQGSPSPRANGDHSESRDRDSIGLNGDRNGEKAGSSKLNNLNDRPPSRSGSSSSRSTPNLKTKDVRNDVKS